MSKATPHPPANRFRLVAQSALIRGYKILGLVALGGILIGLICFFVVNLFYLVNSSWVRPLVLSPTHPSVLSTMAALSNESARLEELMSERDILKAELTGLERIIKLDAEFEKQFGDALDRAGGEGKPKPASYEALMARRERNEAIIERERNAARKTAIERQVASLELAIARKEKVIADIRESAYIVATEKEVTVAFVPYENLDDVREGEPLYSCKWGLLLCSKTGTVGAALNGEVTDTHPNSGKPLRGVMVEIRLSGKDASRERTLFAGSKPFWLL